MLVKLINQVAGRWVGAGDGLLAAVPALVADGRIAKAERLLRAYLARKPADANALNYLGLICHRRAEYAEAVSLISMAVEIAPDIGFFHANLGEAYRSIGLPMRAEHHARESVKLTPDSADFARLSRFELIQTEYFEVFLLRFQFLIAFDNFHFRCSR